MSLVWQLVVIAALFGAVFLLHRRARKTNFERFRAHHARRKYRIVAEPAEGAATADPPPGRDD